MAKRKRPPRKKPTLPLDLQEALATQPVQPPRPEDAPFLELVDQLISMHEAPEQAERERKRVEADACREIDTNLARIFQAEQEQELKRREKARSERLAREKAQKAEGKPKLRASG